MALYATAFRDLERCFFKRKEAEEVEAAVFHGTGSTSKGNCGLSFDKPKERTGDFPAGL